MEMRTNADSWMLHFVMSYMRQNKKREQTLESAQYGIEIIFKIFQWTCLFGLYYGLYWLFFYNFLDPACGFGKNKTIIS